MPCRMPLYTSSVEIYPAARVASVPPIHKMRTDAKVFANYELCASFISSSSLLRSINVSETNHHPLSWSTWPKAHSSIRPTPLLLPAPPVTPPAPTPGLLLLPLQVLTRYNNLPTPAQHLHKHLMTGRIHPSSASTVRAPAATVSGYTVTLMLSRPGNMNLDLLGTGIQSRTSYVASNVSER